MYFKLTKSLIAALLLAFVVVCQSSVGLAAEPAPGVLILKQDRADALQLPANFRTAKDAFKKPAKDGKTPSREGMDKLDLSGSSFFSQLELAKLVSVLPKDRLVILDFRAESHGYLNGMGVSWYSALKRANFGKTADEVDALEHDLLNSALGNTVQVAKLDKEKEIASQTPVNVEQVYTEKELVELFGVKYYRIPVSDYTPPTNENVDQFLEIYKNLPKDAWIHTHCEAGEGRTTTFMSLIDMLHNAPKVSYDDIMKRQVMIGGYDLRAAKSDEPWKKQAYIARAEFMKHFYDYVVNNPDLTMSYSEWAKRNNY